MTSGVLENDNAVEVSKIEAFEEAINKTDRFEMRGYLEDGSSIVVRDTKYDEDSEMSCVEIEIGEILDKPLKCIMGVLDESRNAIVLHGISRIVGYYSRVTNWNSSKIGELRDRIQGRYEGGYGFSGTKVDMDKFNDALSVVDNM